jgi:hypothetical protein
MRRAIATAAAAAAVAAALPLPAGADQGVVGWDGKNPFACTLQQLGGGTDFPEPNADPFCVEYDKRHQNVDKLGVVDFLSKEPARVAAASPKCFYFQHDHWIGSVSEGTPQTQTYAWDGSYYFDKAKGTGGVYVENFSFAGQTGDPTQLPGFPSQYKPFFGNGRGGVRKSGDVQADPNCVKKANEHSPYDTSGPGGGSGAGGKDRCRVPGGTVDRGIGGIRLGERRSDVRKTLGPPTKESLRYVTYCMTGGGRLLAGFDKDGAGGRVLLVLTNAPPFDLRGIRTGDRTSKARKKLHGCHRLAKGSEGRNPLVLRESKQYLVVGTLSGTVRFVADATPKLADKRLKQLLDQMPG